MNDKAYLAEIYAISRPVIDSQLWHSASDRGAVSE